MVLAKAKSTVCGRCLESMMCRSASSVRKFCFWVLASIMALAPVSEAADYFNLYGKMIWLEDRDPDSIWVWDMRLQHVSTGQKGVLNAHSVSIPFDDP